MKMFQKLFPLIVVIKIFTFLRAHSSVGEISSKKSKKEKKVFFYYFNVNRRDTIKMIAQSLFDDAVASLNIG